MNNDERMTADFGGNLGQLSVEHSFQEDVKNEDVNDGIDDKGSEEEGMDVDGMTEDPTQSDAGSSHVPSEEDDDEEADEEDEEDDDEDSEFRADQNSRETSVMDISAMSETGASTATGWTPSTSSAALLSTLFKPVTEWVPFTAVQMDRKLPKKLKKHEYEPLPHGVLVNLSQPSLNVHNYTGQESIKKDRLWSLSDGISPPTITTRPGLSDWLDLAAIHPLEADAFPLFCGPEASPINKEVYSTIRNSMIYAYASLPAIYLSITECYKHLRYEMQDLVVVHRFLERYRLINQEFLTEVVPKALASHEFGSSRQSTPPVNWICSREKSLALSSIQEFKRDLPPDLCFTCQEPISWRTHFSSRKVAIFNVCEACFVDGRFPADITSKDFIRVQGLIGKKEPKTLKENLKMISEWTEEETLKLLDGIEEFGDRWDRISEFVGTKSAKACLYQFLQFSIEDDLYKPGHDEDSENKSHSLLWETYAGQSPNPLMTLLSLLSTSLSPHVAAEAARAALEVAAEDLESDYIVFKGDQKPSTSKLELEHTTRRAAERAFDASLSYTRSLIELEHQIVGANARILTEKQLQRIELKLALLEDVVHQSNKT